MAAPPPLPARQAYALWAPTYDAENAVTWLEDDTVHELTPPLAGLRLLDAACGTGRRLPPPGPRAPQLAVGVDLVPEMLSAARARDTASSGDAGGAASPGTGGSRSHVGAVAKRSAGIDGSATGRPAAALLAAADLRALPFPDAAFDVVWCRLALGHLADVQPAYRELARVARSGAHVIVTDFHAAAARAGHVRSFRDAAGALHTVEHHNHDVVVHGRAAAAAGLTLSRCLEPGVGPAVRHFYAAADRLGAYDAQHGLPLVLALAFRA